MDTGKNTVEKSRGWYPKGDEDPLTHWVSGEANHGGMFEMPVITHVKDNLWQGGYVPDIDLGDAFDVIVSMYPWGKWKAKADYSEFTMYDGLFMDDQTLFKAVAVVEEALAEGKRVLVHCQAGLNRSSLVVATVLIRQGMSADEAITLIRDRRSPTCLCNGTFDKWLRAYGEQW